MADITDDRLREVANPVYVPCCGPDETSRIARELLAAREENERLRVTPAPVMVDLTGGLNLKAISEDLRRLREQRDALKAEVARIRALIREYFDAKYEYVSFRDAAKNRRFETAEDALASEAEGAEAVTDITNERLREIASDQGAAHLIYDEVRDLARELLAAREKIRSKNRLLPSLLAEGVAMERERATKAEAEVERLRKLLDRHP